METAKIILAPHDAFDDGLISKFRKKFGNKLKQALSKVLGLFDATAKVVYIDKAILAVRQTFVKLHETAHSILPWQRKLYAVVEDCEQTIQPELADEYEREANVFATEVLFQCDTFSKEAAQHTFGINTPLKLSKKYGASIYSSVRRYVRTNHRVCAVLVLNPPEFVLGNGFTATLRRIEVSDGFASKFGQISWPTQFTPDDSIGAMVPVGCRKFSKPRRIVITDANGCDHECIVEAFTQTYQVFILICHSGALNKKIVVF